MLVAWLYLLTAISLEVIGTITLKISDGFTKFLPSTLTYLCFAFSLLAFACAIKRIDLGLAYAIWSGIGTLSIVTIGIFYFQEPSSLIKIACITLITIGVVGLQLSSQT